jgi:hypothetical protein
MLEKVDTPVCVMYVHLQRTYGSETEILSLCPYIENHTLVTETYARWQLLPKREYHHEAVEF